MRQGEQRCAQNLGDEFIAPQQHEKAHAGGGGGSGHQSWRANKSVSAAPGNCGARPSPVARPVAAKAQAAQASARRGSIVSPATSIRASRISA